MHLKFRVFKTNFRSKHSDSANLHKPASEFQGQYLYRPSCFPSVKFVLKMPTPLLLPNVDTSTVVDASMDGWTSATQIEAAQSANAS
jgi:hypothetical protein